MKKRRFQLVWSSLPVVILLLLLPCVAAFAGGEDVDVKLRDLKNENSLLEAELRLARTGRSYIVLDLRTESDSLPGTIHLKNRGILLREFNVEQIRYRGTRGPVVEPASLIKKKAFFPPRRNEIKPRKPEEGDDAASELDFLELKDMPARYTLSFGQSLRISIAGQPEGVVSRGFYGISSVLKHILYSIRIAWNHLWRDEFSVVEITMSKEDAQALYWSLNEGMNLVAIEGRSSERFREPFLLYPASLVLVGVIPFLVYRFRDSISGLMSKVFKSVNSRF